ncbi:MAG TPA: ParB/RepB/Spo0J family partition protein, partial [Nitrospira sp.]|nr:ParB/RepB/Spo0J family partition protein [Nitrospira sp.]
DANRLKELGDSIRRHGIMSPLIVEENGERFTLIDGERRYRASKNIRLDEVPVVIRPKNTMTTRLIEQFHIQEQHEGWTGVEKAIAVNDLANQLKTSVMDMARTLSIPDRTAGEYLAFSKILEKNAYQKGEIPISYAARIVTLREFVKRTWLRHNKEFTEDKERELEKAIMARIKDGTLKRKQDIVKIQDAVKTDHTIILKFIKDSKMTVDGLFLASNAKSAEAVRQLRYSLSGIIMHSKQAIALGGMKQMKDEEGAKNQVERAIEALRTVKQYL